MKLESSETLQCLVNAFAGESQARNRYTIYAKVAENEREHAKLFYNHIPNAQHWHVTADYPFFLGNTYENLRAAADGEREEWEYVYKHGARIAKEEGFDEISKLFAGVLEIEKHHAYRYEVLAIELKNKTLLSKDEETQWHCRKCGHIQISRCAPNECPVCKHPQGYFEIFAEKY